MNKSSRVGRRFHVFFFWMALLCTACSGCSHFTETERSFRDANDSFSKGSYQAALKKYQEILEKDPARGDAALFEMGVIHSYPKNEEKSLEKSLQSFQQLLKAYPNSSYRQDSEMMVSYLVNVTMKNQLIGAQQAEIEALQQEVKEKESDILALQGRIKSLEQKLVGFAIKNRSVDRILIEKKERRLSVLSKGEVLKTYKVALGGNPVGPKEKHDDNKTPEGSYIIDSRNRNSHYHLALHISYPNERDRRRAKQLGVCPGGDIMIHGIKNGMSWVGEHHTQVDWTKGCIAVTDEEIEEIDKLVQNGTAVEIVP